MIDGHDNRIIYPKRQTLRQCLLNNIQARCLCLTLLIYLFLMIIFWCNVENFKKTLITLKLIPIDDNRSSLNVSELNKCQESFKAFPIICIIVLYIAYIVECWHSSTRFLLLNGKNIQSAYDYIDQMRQAKPIIWWKAASYHFIRYHQSNVSCQLNGLGQASNNNNYSTSITTRSTSRIYKKRIDTRCSSSCFQYDHYELKDISEIIVGLELFPITRINFQKGFVFTDETSAREFDRQRSNFFRSNLKLDQYLEIREGINLTGIDYQYSMITIGGNNRKQFPYYWYCTSTAFWIFSSILLSWPFRILLHYNTAYVNHKVVKLFTLFDNRHDIRQPLSLLPTQMTSIDSLSNYIIAPSYSEAILNDRSNDSSRDDRIEKAKNLQITKEEIYDNLSGGYTLNSSSQRMNVTSLPSYDEVIRSGFNDSVGYEKIRYFKHYLMNLFPTADHYFNPRRNYSNLKRSRTDNEFFNHVQFLTDNELNSRPLFGSLKNVTIANV